MSRRKPDPKQVAAAELVEGNLTGAHGAPLPVEYAGVDTRNAEANLASRSNILRD